MPPSAAGGGDGEAHELDHAALSSTPLPDGQALGDAVAAVAAAVRENVRLRRGFRLGVGSTAGSAAGGVPTTVGSYIHLAAGPGLGRIAALVALEGPAAPSAADLAHKLAMQVVGARARYLSREEVPAEVVEAERALLREQALKSGERGGERRRRRRRAEEFPRGTGPGLRGWAQPERDGAGERFHQAAQHSGQAGCALQPCAPALPTLPTPNPARS